MTEERRDKTMAILNEGCVKKQTIRSLVSECQKLQGEIRGHLEKNFDRNLKEANVKCEGKPSMPNVLDEIMDELRTLSNSQKETVDFILNLISPKL